MATRHRLSHHPKLVCQKGIPGTYGYQEASVSQVAKGLWKLERSDGLGGMYHDDTELEEAMAQFEPDFRKWQPPKEGDIS